jgi:RNA polymerase sigma factor (TIGR02999 family)
MGLAGRPAKATVRCRRLNNATVASAHDTPPIKRREREITFKFFAAPSPVMIPPGVDPGFEVSYMLGVGTPNPADGGSPPAPLTRLLERAAAGDAGAGADAVVRVYEELRLLARQRLASERAGHTLQATALVNEAYLRLIDSAGGALNFAGRAHFFHAAAEAMRRVLVEHARARSRLKRGGGEARRVALVELTGVADLAAADSDPAEILTVDEAIRRLEEQSPDVGAVVRLRFYAGLSPKETAEALGVSESTVYREWNFARAWLYRELGGAKWDGDARR